MRTFAAICISACVGVASFIPLSPKGHHTWKSSRLSARKTHYEGGEPSTTVLLTSEALASLIVPTASPPPASVPVVTLQTDTSGWEQIAICEEHGANDPVAGYFGILSSNWPQGESPANMDYAAQRALAYSLNKGQVPWCPPNCANGGYKGW